MIRVLGHLLDGLAQAFITLWSTGNEVVTHPSLLVSAPECSFKFRQSSPCPSNHATRPVQPVLLCPATPLSVAPVQYHHQLAPSIAHWPASPGPVRPRFAHHALLIPIKTTPLHIPPPLLPYTPHPTLSASTSPHQHCSILSQAALAPQRPRHATV